MNREMNIVMSGASGLVGTAVARRLERDGHRVRRLVRHPAAGAGESRWEPSRGEFDPSAFSDVDAVINLSGENLAAGRWTAARRARIRESRVDATRTLARAVLAAPRAPSVFVNASAVGAYGDAGDRVLTEASPFGDGFLPEVCRAWEAETRDVSRAGIRTALLRFGVILAAEGGALAKMLPWFRRGLGGRLGSGQQWMSWVSLDDVVGVIVRVLEDERLSGPLNVVAPTPVTNEEFTRVLAHAVGRSARLPAPAWGLRLALGREMAEAALLASTRAMPKRLMEFGYAFAHPTLPQALAAVLPARQV